MLLSNAGRALVGEKTKEKSAMWVLDFSFLSFIAGEKAMNEKTIKTALLIGMLLFAFAVLVYTGIKTINTIAKPNVARRIGQYWVDGNAEFSDFSFEPAGLFMSIEEKGEKAKIHPAVLGLLLFVVVGSAVFGLIQMI